MSINVRVIETSAYVSFVNINGVVSFFEKRMPTDIGDVTPCTAYYDNATGIIYRYIGRINELLAKNINGCLIIS